MLVMSLSEKCGGLMDSRLSSSSLSPAQGRCVDMFLGKNLTLTLPLSTLVYNICEWVLANFILGWGGGEPLVVCLYGRGISCNKMEHLGPIQTLPLHVTSSSTLLKQEASKLIKGLSGLKNFVITPQ